MKIHLTSKAGVHVLSLVGDFINEVDQFMVRDRIQKLAKEGKTQLIVDLTDVKYINSCGLGSLVCGLTTVRKMGGDLRLVGVGPDVAEVLRITKLDSIFQIYGTVTEAHAGVGLTSV